MPRALAFIAELAVGDRRLHRGSPTLGGANECTNIRLRTTASPNAFGMILTAFLNEQAQPRASSGSSFVRAPAPRLLTMGTPGQVVGNTIRVTPIKDVGLD